MQGIGREEEREEEERGDKEREKDQLIHVRGREVQELLGWEEWEKVRGGRSEGERLQRCCHCCGFILGWFGQELFWPAELQGFAGHSLCECSSSQEQLFRCDFSLQQHTGLGMCRQGQGSLLLVLSSHSVQYRSGIFFFFLLRVS